MDKEIVRWLPSIWALGVVSIAALIALIVYLRGVYQHSEEGCTFKEACYKALDNAMLASVYGLVAGILLPAAPLIGVVYIIVKLVFRLGNKKHTEKTLEAEMEEKAAEIKPQADFGGSIPYKPKEL